MIVVSTSRRAGKTSQVIDWFAADWEHRAIVAFSEGEAMRLRSMVRGDHPDIPYAKLATRIVRLDQARSLFRGTSVTEVAVDNAELVLEGLLGTRLAMMTYTP